jgi:nicotinamidase-related amidase
MNKALLVIDIQNDYFSGGKMELVGSAEAAKQAAHVQRLFRAAGLPIIHVQHIALSPSASFFLPGTFGAEIHQDVAPIDGETLVTKHFPNAFRETNLKEILTQHAVTDLTVVGMMTHMCIDTTVRAASDFGIKVTLVGDACATKNLEFDGLEVPAASVQAAYLAALDGSFATVVTADSLGDSVS